jgi:hypothetical protein
MAIFLAELQKNHAVICSGGPALKAIVARDKTADGHLWYPVDHGRLLPPIMPFARGQPEERAAA